MQQGWLHARHHGPIPHSCMANNLMYLGRIGSCNNAERGAAWLMHACEQAMWRLRRQRTQHEAQRGVIAREHEACDAALVERRVPAHRDVVPRLPWQQSIAFPQEQQAAASPNAAKLHVYTSQDPTHDHSKLLLWQAIRDFVAACCLPVTPSWHDHAQPPVQRAGQTHSGTHTRHRTCMHLEYLGRLPLLQPTCPAHSAAAGTCANDLGGNHRLHCRQRAELPAGAGSRARSPHI